MSKPQFINIEAFGDISGKNLMFLRDLENLINKHLADNNKTELSSNSTKYITAYIYGDISVDELIDALNNDHKEPDIKADDQSKYDYWYLARKIAMPTTQGGLTINELCDIWHTPFYEAVLKMDPDDAMSMYNEYKRTHKEVKK